jgi:uncharacterized protein YbcV (DUF1398 family)
MKATNHLLYFAKAAAQCGVLLSVVLIIEMTCTYLSAEGDAIVIEKLPV